MSFGFFKPKKNTPLPLSSTEEKLEFELVGDENPQSRLVRCINGSRYPEIASDNREIPSDLRILLTDVFSAIPLASEKKDHPFIADLRQQVKEGIRNKTIVDLKPADEYMHKVINGLLLHIERQINLKTTVSDRKTIEEKINRTISRLEIKTTYGKELSEEESTELTEAKNSPEYKKMAAVVLECTTCSEQGAKFFPFVLYEGAEQIKGLSSYANVCQLPDEKTLTRQFENFHQACVNNFFIEARKKPLSQKNIDQCAEFQTLFNGCFGLLNAEKPESTNATKMLALLAKRMHDHLSKQVVVTSQGPIIIPSLLTDELVQCLQYMQREEPSLTHQINGILSKSPSSKNIALSKHDESLLAARATEIERLLPSVPSRKLSH